MAAHVLYCAHHNKAGHIHVVCSPEQPRTHPFVMQALGGMEDIPDGVVALLTRSSTDVLSHVAIRARTQGVLLAGCSDEEEWLHLLELQVGLEGNIVKG